LDICWQLNFVLFSTSRYLFSYVHSIIYSIFILIKKLFISYL